MLEKFKIRASIDKQTIVLDEQTIILRNQQKTHIAENCLKYIILFSNEYKNCLDGLDMSKHEDRIKYELLSQWKLKVVTEFQESFALIHYAYCDDNDVLEAYYRLRENHFEKTDPCEHCYEIDCIENFLKSLVKSTGYNIVEDKRIVYSKPIIMINLFK